MYGKALDIYRHELDVIHDAGTWKSERPIASQQGVEIVVKGRTCLNLCANNYLGLSSHPAVIEAARKGLDTRGFGMSSVRFICGTQDVHAELEARLARFFGYEEAILFSSCFDANGGVFETLLSAEDAIVSDALNHASLIDGIRLCKAARHRYANGDMADLEAKLRETQGARLRLIATDGVFSMDGTLAPLDRICALAEKYDAMVLVDDSHASGFIGKTGRGTAEHFGMMGKVDILTSTLGKALGGASGGFIAAKKEVVELLRQRARPYLFSNALAPSIATASLKVLDLLEEHVSLRDQLMENTALFRSWMARMGFNIRQGEHPIVPILLGDACLAGQMATRMFEEGVYVTGFSYPVVPKGEARIRVQLSASHTSDQLMSAIESFTKVGRELEVI